MKLVASTAQIVQHDGKTYLRLKDGYEIELDEEAQKLLKENKINEPVEETK